MTAADAQNAFGLLRRHPAFRTLWASRAVSFLGGSLSTVALILYVADRTGAGSAVALLMLVGELLPTLLSPVAGALADRLAPRRLLLACELGQGVMMALVALLLPNLALLLVLIVAKSAFAVVFDPAGRAVLPRLVADHQLEPANAALGLGTNGLDVAGPLLAAALLPVLGLRGILWLDVASFGLSAVLLSRLPRLGRVGSVGPAPGIWAEAREGLRYVADNRMVRAVAVGFWAVVLCTGIDDVVLVFLVRDELRGGDVAVSVLYAAVGLGLLVGFLLLAVGGRARPALVLVVLGFAVSAGGNLLTGLAWAVPVAFACQAVRGLGIAMIDTGLPAAVARAVPEHLRGRVFAVTYGGVSLAVALSYVVGGAALGAVSPRLVLVVAGGLGLVAAGLTAVAIRAARTGGTGRARRLRSV
ncbi:MFS transporter [Plantactinospora siamensis]|uniref:MFS transporter n=1 Tax=Plantactinospora siamensis TaxID=555372 RepID=A0ABV6NVF7_9ACTN